MKEIGLIFFKLFTDTRKWETGWMLAPMTYFVNEYVFRDWHFLMNLMIIVTIDTILGFIFAYKAKTISSEAFSRVLNKILVYSLVLIATHTACNMKINGEINFMLSWVDSFVYTTIVVRELISIFEKTTKLGYFKPPAWILAKLKDFNDTGELIKKDTP